MAQKKLFFFADGLIVRLLNVEKCSLPSVYSATPINPTTHEGSGWIKKPGRRISQKSSVSLFRKKERGCHIKTEVVVLEDAVERWCCIVWMLINFDQLDKLFSFSE